VGHKNPLSHNNSNRGWDITKPRAHTHPHTNTRSSYEPNAHVVWNWSRNFTSCDTLPHSGCIRIVSQTRVFVMPGARMHRTCENRLKSRSKRQGHALKRFRMRPHIAGARQVRKNTAAIELAVGARSSLTGLGTVLRSVIRNVIVNSADLFVTRRHESDGSSVYRGH
jgi:hypothetical protein